MKNSIALLSLLAMPAAFAAEVRTSTFTLSFDEGRNGVVSSIKTAAGVEFASDEAVSPFLIDVCQKADPNSRVKGIDATSAKNCTCEKVNGGVRLVYSGFAQGLSRFSATVTARADGKGVAIRTETEPAPGMAVETVTFPRVKLRAGLGAEAADDALVTGRSVGGVFRNLVGKDGKPRPLRVKVSAPGQLSVQMMAYYDPAAMFYAAAEDGNGRRKALKVKTDGAGFVMDWTARTFSAEKYAPDYDLVFDAWDRGSSAEPITWYDAADRYRAWAEKQAWCKVKYLDRQDIPVWMKDAPAMSHFFRWWFDKPERIYKWLDLFRKECGDAAPVVMGLWGWEKPADWITDYFPCYPSDEFFRDLVGRFKAKGMHTFCWPSGYRRAESYGKKKDGTYKWECKAQLKAEGVSEYAAYLRNGWVLKHGTSWSDGGDIYHLCGGHPKTCEWFCRDVISPLLDRGVEMIQVDQVVGGEFWECYAGSHPHAPGFGLDNTALFRGQLGKMQKTMRAKGVTPVLGYEEPCEYFNDLIGIQDYRDTTGADGEEQERADEFAGVFNYIYHEYVKSFQSFPNRQFLPIFVYQAVHGQIPAYMPDYSDVDEPAKGAAYRAFMKDWIALYRGEGRPFLECGREIRPPRIVCDKSIHLWRPGGPQGHTVQAPAVMASAFVSSDGKRKAVFLGNASGHEVSGSLVRGNRKIDFRLAPYELKMLNPKKQ